MIDALDVYERAVSVGKGLAIGAGLTLAMIFIALPVGVLVWFGVDAIITGAAAFISDMQS